MEIRNFAIIAHVDHGKSTLADRLLEKTGVIKEGSVNQALDTMDLERERGITIKLNPARMFYALKGQDYQLNLIDTPGHVDFNYEVSRSLAAVEGVILLVDASQGVQAQTLTNLHLAQSLNLAIIPVVNKIDLPTAEVEKTTLELVDLIGCQEEDICYVSGKTGEGVDNLLNNLIKHIPCPRENEHQSARALVFDSLFDKYLGVIAYVKIIDGQIDKNQHLQLKATKVSFPALELGYMQISRVAQTSLKNGEIGFIATGLKSVQDCRVGDTIALDPTSQPLPGYRQPQPMVYATFFPEKGQETILNLALGKLQLNDAALTFKPVQSQALGQGFNIGFLGLLHLEIVKERLEREYGVDVLVSPPSVAYEHGLEMSREPWVNLEVVAPSRYYGVISDLAARHRAKFVNVSHLTDMIVCQFEAPLAEVIVDFYDSLKSVTAGYASMDYSYLEYRPVDLAQVDLLIAGEKVDALSQYIVRSKAESFARQMVERLKDLIPRQTFEVSIQAAIGGKIIARADISALRKDVTAKLYGGDVTRKRKLLEKQKKGKKKMRSLGRVEVPTSVFIELLKK